MAWRKGPRQRRARRKESEEGKEQESEEAETTAAAVREETSTLRPSRRQKKRSARSFLKRRPCARGRGLALRGRGRLVVVVVVAKGREFFLVSKRILYPSYLLLFQRVPRFSFRHYATQRRVNALEWQSKKASRKKKARGELPRPFLPSRERRCCGRVFFPVESERSKKKTSSLLNFSFSAQLRIFPSGHPP